MISAYSFAEANICFMHVRVRLRVLVKIKESSSRSPRLISEVMVLILTHFSEENKCSSYAAKCMLREFKMVTSLLCLTKTAYQQFDSSVGSRIFQTGGEPNPEKAAPIYCLATFC